MVISVLSNIASGPVEKKVVQTPQEENTAPIVKETEYEYLFWSAEYQPQQQYYLATDRDTDSMKKFAQKKAEWKDFDYYAVFVTDKKFAKFPKNPITALDFPTEQAKNIVAIYVKTANWYENFQTYLGENDWQNLAITDTIK